ncbi:Alpha/Beta hydrolase protein [Xylariaceae sp. FL0016]|nr:Alpha/Beta hydrolase protein [Xylariaceae sp. FL0016]
MQLRSVLTVLAGATFGACASLQQVTSFGDNPSSIAMYIYVPEKVATKPAIVVALHPCGGSGPSWYSGTKLPSYADANGFILIYPSTNHMSNCWDVNNAASLTHGAGGDAKGIISMVNYTLTKYAGDSSKVYVMGGSSGAMMTNVMAGSYPDVFKAGAAYSGTPHACFAGAASATPFSPNQTCAQGLTHTPAQWGDFVRNSYPGYTGRRPRMMIVHGLADTLVRPACAVEALKQWSDVLGVEWTKNVTGMPSAAYTQEIYGDGTKLQGYFGQGVGHIAPVNEPVMLKFFGLVS